VIGPDSAVCSDETAGILIVCLAWPVNGLSLGDVVPRAVHPRQLAPRWPLADNGHAVGVSAHGDEVVVSLWRFLLILSFDGLFRVLCALTAAAGCGVAIQGASAGLLQGEWVVAAAFWRWFFEIYPFVALVAVVDYGAALRAEGLWLGAASLGMERRWLMAALAVPLLLLSSGVALAQRAEVGVAGQGAATMGRASSGPRAEATAATWECPERTDHGDAWVGQVEAAPRHRRSWRRWLEPFWLFPMLGAALAWEEGQRRRGQRLTRARSVVVALGIGLAGYLVWSGLWFFIA